MDWRLIAKSVKSNEGETLELFLMRACHIINVDENNKISSRVNYNNKYRAKVRSKVTDSSVQ